MTAGCTLCRRVFTGPASGQIFDAQGQDAAQTFLVNLANHIREEHAEIAAQVEISALQYRGYLLMGYYNVTNDDAFNEMREETRRLMHATTRKVVVTNDELRIMAAIIAGNMDLDISADQDGARDNIYTALVDLRDRLCEMVPEPVKLTV